MTCAGLSDQGHTHYVRVDNLTPKIEYAFDIVSGDKTYTNNGTHWSVLLGEVVPRGRRT